jgi:hypothetical protein
MTWLQEFIWIILGQLNWFQVSFLPKASIKGFYQAFDWHSRIGWSGNVWIQAVQQQFDFFLFEITFGQVTKTVFIFVETLFNWLLKSIIKDSKCFVSGNKDIGQNPSWDLLPVLKKIKKLLNWAILRIFNQNFRFIPLSIQTLIFLKLGLITQASSHLMLLTESQSKFFKSSFKYI